MKQRVRKTENMYCNYHRRHSLTGPACHNQSVHYYYAQERSSKAKIECSTLRLTVLLFNYIATHRSSRIMSPALWQEEKSACSTVRTPHQLLVNRKRNAHTSLNTPLLSWHPIDLNGTFTQSSALWSLDLGGLLQHSARSHTNNMIKLVCKSTITIFHARVRNHLCGTYVLYVCIYIRIR